MLSSHTRKAVVTGGTGLIGRHLVAALTSLDAQVAVVTRTPQRAILPKGATAHPWKELPAILEGADAVFNLAGAGLADARWTDLRKQAILQSRLESTRRIVEALAWVSQKPSVVLNASAIGYYGPSGQVPVDENRPNGKGFLAEVCKEWEMAIDGLQTKGIRVAKIRMGVVLAKDGGVLPKIARPVKMFLGCPFGNGRQGFSWIHIEDLIRLLMDVANHSEYEGPINATSPHPISQKAFLQLLAGRLHRPIWPLPALMTRTLAKWALGEMAGPLLLHGAYVYPKKALTHGFEFRFATAETALTNLL
jgi:uncharacterized protein